MTKRNGTESLASYYKPALTRVTRITSNTCNRRITLITRNTRITRITSITRKTRKTRNSRNTRNTHNTHITRITPIPCINSLGTTAHICAHLFRTFRVHSAYMRALEIIHANCHGCLPSLVEQGTQLDQLQL